MTTAMTKTFCGLATTSLTLLLLAGCASAPPAAHSSPGQSIARAQRVHIEGELTDNGLGCKALRSPDGTLYTFARELEGTKKGERIWVDGYVVPESGCASGVNVMPRRAGLMTATASR